MSFLVLPNSVPCLEEGASNWSNFATRFREAMLTMHRWGHFDGTNACPIPKDAACPTTAEGQAIKEWKREDGMAQGLLSPRLPDCIFIHLINHKTAKARWDQLTKLLGQPVLEESEKEKGLTSELPSATGRGSSHGQRRGKHHACGEEGHSARDCRAPKEELTAVPAAEEPSGAVEQPETSPTDAIHADFEGEGCLPQVPTQNLHAQTIGAEPEAISGEPGAIGFGQPGNPNANIPKGVAHGEPDSIPGEDSHRNMNAPVHPVGTGPVILLEENSAAGKNASIEGDEVPCVELQEPGVSHLTAVGENKFLTSSPSPSITLEAACTQSSPAVNTTTLGILEPDCGADLDPPPHDTPPPISSEAARTQRSPAVNTGTPAIPDPEC